MDVARGLFACRTAKHAPFERQKPLGGRQEQIGSISIGKNADLAVIKGDPATHISDIENVEIVFKDGVGYDTQKLLESAKGHYGEF